MVGAAVLAGSAAATASAQQYPLTSGDPRIGLAAGPGDTAGKVSLGMQHLSNTPLPPVVNNINSDAAFQGNYAFVGNFNGVNIYDVSNPATPQLVTALRCIGSQNDVSVHGNLLFVSVESGNAKRDCTASNAAEGVATPETRFRGIRIFDITDIRNPKRIQGDGVTTCRGSHTHTLLTPKSDPNNVYIYVSGTSSSSTGTTAIAGLNCNNAPATDPNSSFWRIEVIKVPLANPSAAAVVNESRLFADPATGRIDGLQNAPQSQFHPCANATPACVDVSGNPNQSGRSWSPTPITDACHDITVYEEIGLAAGACEGNGILVDISDPANPKRIDAVADPLFAYWHGATFSNDGKAILFTDEWGGGNYARCRATDQLSWGADAIYEIVNKKLVFRSYYKLPVAQTLAENCVSHVGNLVPVRGKNIMIQAWYQGGASLIDWTNLSAPKEIGYFDRGPVNATQNPSTGGFWSTYWYNGTIYGTELSRGLDTFKLTATPGGLTADDIRSTEVAAKLARSNPQSQVSAVYTESPPVTAPVGGTVPATLSLSLAAPANFGPFTPGVAKLYETSTGATVTHTAGDALLSVSDAGPNPGFLVNGAFSLPQPLQLRARNAANTGTAYNNVGSSLNLLQYSGPVSNDAVSLQFAQQINANDALRTGTYGKTLTFTLSTTNP
ncbi:hypothetical protein OJ998_01475 [Solirubrobacter taibaiensis]|nr:hypothetical protein [Solirubrobacter taibaiensis]